MIDSLNKQRIENVYNVGIKGHTR